MCRGTTTLNDARHEAWAIRSNVTLEAKQARLNLEKTMRLHHKQQMREAKEYAAQTVLAAKEKAAQMVCITTQPLPLTD